MDSDTAQLQAWRTGRPTRFRATRAYWLTVRILLGYLWLRLWKPVLGASLYNQLLVARHRRTSRRLTSAILDLGGLFIKVGQLISILTNILPVEFRSELEQLQDSVPARPIGEVTARIRKELGASPAELFTDFDPVPIASASLAQVHVAWMPDGRKVAVKVQHADIEEISRIDLAILARVFMLVQMIVRIRGMEEYPADIAEMIRNELDFRQEARNIATVSANFAGNPEISFPTVVPERSSQRVLTTEFVEGTKVTDIAELEARGIDRRALAKRILTMSSQMVFVDGVFHADPHPGNIIVHDDGRVTMLDLGAIGRLAPGVRAGIRVFWQGLVARDPSMIAAGLSQAGLISRDEDDVDVAERAINYFQRRFFEQMHAESWGIKDIQVDMRTRIDALFDLQKLDISFRDLSRAFTVPKEWVLFERASILSLGLCTELDPDMNLIGIIGPYLQEFVIGKDASAKTEMSSIVRETAMQMLALPDKTNRLLDRAGRGGVAFQIGGLRESALLLYAAVHQVLFALLAMGFAALARALAAAGERGLSLVAWTAATLLIIAVFWSILRARKLERRLLDRGRR